MNNPTLTIKNNLNEDNINILNILTKLVNEKQNQIDAWFDNASKNTMPFFYNSVDIRHSGYKIAPVDTNLFPAGFNNLSDKGKTLAVKYTIEYIKKYHKNTKHILLICEDHTRNEFYLENIYILKTIIEDAGLKVTLTNFAVSNTKESAIYKSKSNKDLLFEPVVKQEDEVRTLDGKDIFDIILVNNDLTIGAPDLMQNIKQPIIPPVGFGWYQRRKTSHFNSYNDLARDFCYKFDIDPWLISTLFSKCGVINFKQMKNVECVAKRVDKLLAKIQNKYNEYNIKQEPYVFVKSNRGTYGMGIMTAKSADDIYSMTKNIRKKMNVIKGGEANTEVIIQEGVPTIDYIDNKPAELMYYLISGKSVDSIYRVNSKKDAFVNLNSTGMEFMNYHNEDHFKAVDIIAKLAAQAAAWECYTETYDI